MEDNNEIIRILSERSGKTRKYQVLALETTPMNDQLVFVVFLVGVFSKICCVMSEAEKDRRGIGANQSFFVKNCQHVSTIGNIPVFKLTSTSVFRSSSRQDSNVQTFSVDETAAILSGVVPGDFIQNILPQNQQINLNPQLQQNNGNVVPLNTFCSNPASFHADQYVEVFNHLY